MTTDQIVGAGIIASFFLILFLVLAKAMGPIGALILYGVTVVIASVIFVAAALLSGQLTLSRIRKAFAKEEEDEHRSK
jgi:hypothetical protein